jgi:hypothetical protein
MARRARGRPLRESAVWQATSQKNAPSGAPPVISDNVKDKLASYFVVKVAHPVHRLEQQAKRARQSGQ